MSDKTEATTNAPTLISRYEQLPTAKKALLGQMVISYAMTLHQVKAAAHLPDDGLVSSIGNFISSLEPK